MGSKKLTAPLRVFRKVCYVDIPFATAHLYRCVTLFVCMRAGVCVCACVLYSAYLSIAKYINFFRKQIEYRFKICIRLVQVFFSSTLHLTFIFKVKLFPFYLICKYIMDSNPEARQEDMQALR